MHRLSARSVFICFLVSLPLLNAQLNPADAPSTTWNPDHLNEYERIVSTCTLDAYCSDTKQWDLLSHIFTEDAVASYTADSNLSVGIDAIRYVHVHGTAGLITQHLLSNFLVDISDDCRTANATYYAIATLFSNPQESASQFVNLYGWVLQSVHHFKVRFVLTVETDTTMIDW